MSGRESKLASSASAGSGSATHPCPATRMASQQSNSLSMYPSFRVLRTAQHFADDPGVSPPPPPPPPLPVSLSARHAARGL